MDCFPLSEQTQVSQVCPKDRYSLCVEGLLSPLSQKEEWKGNQRIVPKEVCFYHISFEICKKTNSC